MSKQYGLIAPTKKQAPVTRPKIFGSDSDDETPAPKPTSLKRLKPQDKFLQEKAVEEDPSVYQYDEIYDQMDQKRKELLRNKNQDRKPKYIAKLLETADRRKRENERRIERQVQKEREDEGEEFKDKEAFVTSAYKRKLEEMKEMEEQEKREEYLEEVGSVRKQGNLDGFYRHLYDQKVNYEERMRSENVEVKQEPEENEDDKPEPDENEEDAAPKNKKRKYRQRRNSEDEADDTKETDMDSKEHLQSNLDADSDFSIDSSDEETKDEAKKQETVVAEAKPEDEKGEEKPVEKPIPEVEPEPEVPKVKIDIWKKRTIDDVFTEAVLRYHERKALRSGITF